MSWKFVYNVKVTGREGDDKYARGKAKDAGYKFYLWNGVVRFTLDGESTGITEDDLY